ncbi:hypothetical protein DCO44_10995 [Acinetobacter sp. AM]|uniref:hypothetical protein n=1 Tax=Acinetobacter sp. AM TaxID=2170730 RepID=UPI000DE76A9E|nr:hypothetical protein [Acinetobacter sp. AM]PWB14080.1 hypothetical protein DCO44_10995 [Acinetobacter sp. AM]
MELNKNPEHILLVFEGESTEYKIYELLEKHQLGLDKKILATFKAEVYQLYRQVIDEGADLLLLLKDKNPSLSNISQDNISSIFLFFDFDCHATQAEDLKIKELLDHFDNETEEGKLFISYPMVEAFKYFTHCDDLMNFLNFYVKRIQVPMFKQISHQESDHRKTWQKMTKDDCQRIINMHCIKASYLVNKTDKLYEGDIAQKTIFDIHDGKDEVYVLSAFPLMLKYYYSFTKFCEKMNS